MPDDCELTPMMRQYREAKAASPPDSLLLFRLGDFYEMFFEDAIRGSALLDVTLTKRGGVPMCGIPHHALDNYLPKVLATGTKVAIADQLEDPKLAKGIVKRGVTRVITPGTIIDAAALSPNQCNYLASIARRKDRFGLACLEISTGQFHVTELDNADELRDELNRLNPSECVASASLLGEWERAECRPAVGGKMAWTPLDDWHFDFSTAEELLKRHFGVLSLDGFGLANLDLAVVAAGAALRYALDNLKQEAKHIDGVRTYLVNDFMALDPATRRNLELVESLRGGKESTLLWVLDETKTPMGGRLIRDWLLRPLRDRGAINARLDSVDKLKYDPLTLAEFREVLGQVRDLERVVARLNVGSANARDLVALARGLEAVPDLRKLLAGHDTPLLASLRDGLCEFQDVVAMIDAAVVDEPPPTLTDGGMIRDGYNADLDAFRSASKEGKNWIAALQAKEQERTGIKSLKIRYNKVFGYYIEITKSNLGQVPYQDYVRKQTLANAERFITPELKEVEDKVLGSEDKAKALEHEIFQELRSRCVERSAQIRSTAAALGSLDALSGLAEAARKHNYRRPLIRDDGALRILGGRHPVLDVSMRGERFVPNDTLLDDADNRVLVITGPNMAGKSTYIRQVALLTLMAQAGSFIPVESAEIGVVDRIFTRVGAADDLSRGQSTFMVEMVETANILAHASERSLVILDEIGRGTSTFDGLSIAWAVAEHLHDEIGAKTLFATHYHELTELALTRSGVKNYNVAVREYGDKIVFLRQIVPGGADKSYGIHVAKLAGLPKAVLERSKEILDNLERDAIAEGVPALAERHAVADFQAQPKAVKKRKGGPPQPGTPVQMSLFEW